MARLIFPDGREVKVKPDISQTRFSLAMLQRLVGGYVEFVRGPDGLLVVVDEEGKRKGKVPNPVATALVRDALSDDDFLVGDALVLGKRERPS